MSKSALKNKPASQLTAIPIHPVTWDVVEVNNKVEGLGVTGTISILTIYTKNPLF